MKNPRARNINSHGLGFKFGITTFYNGRVSRAVAGLLIRGRLSFSNNPVGICPNYPQTGNPIPILILNRHDN